jgi:hypothetical protein
MSRPLLVFENIETTPRYKLFRFQGVDVMATRYAWLSAPFFCVLGTLIAWSGGPEDVTGSTMTLGVEFGALLYLTNALHSLGHVFAARILASPMEVLLLTATRDVTLYRKSGPRPTKWMLIGRSLGGPLANMFTGFAFLVLWQLSSESWSRACGVFNVAIAVWTLCPIPTMDGWVIWGELFGFRKHENVP